MNPPQVYMCSPGRVQVVNNWKTGCQRNRRWQIKSIALRKDELGVDEIRLYDLDQERQDKVAVVVKWILDEELKSGIKLTVTYDVEEAYRDADFIFAQMRVGKYALREMDEKIPLKHGCVGQETCGCGGLALVREAAREYGEAAIADVVSLRTTIYV